jgi:biopolymer transport protein ExbD
MVSTGARDGEFGLQIAPMLDVLFVLLLFFMVAAGAIKREAAIVTQVPGGGSQPVAVNVSIDAGGTVEVNGMPYDAAGQDALPVTISRLQAMVADDANLSLLISPAPATRQQRVVDVLNACTAAGIHHLAFGSAGN